MMIAQGEFRKVLNADTAERKEIFRKTFSNNDINILKKYVIDFYENNERRSIPYNSFLEEGYEIKKGYYPRLFYLDVIKKIYFCE